MAIKVKGNVVPEHTIKDLGKKVAFGEELVINEEEYKKSSDLKEAIRRGFLSLLGKVRDLVTVRKLNIVHTTPKATFKPKIPNRVIITKEIHVAQNPDLDRLIAERTSQEVRKVLEQVLPSL